MSDVEDLSLSLNRTGDGWHLLDLSPLEASEIATQTVPAADIPDPTEINFEVLGNDVDGYVVGYHHVLASHARTNDGGATFDEFTPSLTLGFVWVDAAGNRYTHSGSNVWRAPAGSWTFALAFTFAEGFATGFSFAADGVGGVFFAEYAASGSGTRGTQFWRSVDFGETWAAQTIEYDQKHLHAVHVHAPTGNVYLAVGEAYDETQTWRGILKSTDRGATFTQVEIGDNSYGAQHQPTSAVTVGDYILWGQDSNPSGWLRHDTRDDSIEVVQARSIIGAGPNYTGFYFSQVDLGDAVFVSPNATDNDSAFAAMVMRGTDTPLAVWASRYDERPWGTWSFGPDAAGYVYVQDADDAEFCHVFATPTVVDREATVVGKSGGSTIAGSFDGAAGILPGETHHGEKILRVDGPTPGDEWDNGIQTVVAGETLTATWLMRRGPGNAENLQLQFLWYTGGVFGTASGVTVYPNLMADDDEFYRCRLRFNVPATRDGLVLRWFLTSPSTADNYHDVVSGLVITRDDVLDPAWSPTPFTDEVSFTHAIGGRFFFRDRIYLQEAARATSPGDMLLLEANDIEVGLRVAYPVSAAESTIYIKQAGVEIATVRADQMGGTVDPSRPVHERISPRVHPMNFVPAPIIVGIAKTEVLLYNNETGATVTTPLTSLTSPLAVTLHGSAVHVPDLFHQVEAADRERVLRLAGTAV